MNPHCYSLRRLSPYQGVLQVVEWDMARAVSLDGVHWRVQVQQQRQEKGFAHFMPASTSLRYVVFGLWSAADGWVRVPVHPLAQWEVLQEKAEALLAVLPECSQPLPFPLEDIYEFWLLDGDTAQPLALLDSAHSHVNSDDLSCAHLEWQPAAQSDLSFHSAQFEAPNHHGRVPQYHRHVLADQVHKKAGRPFPAQWFKRQTDGSGVGLQGKHISAQVQQRTLPAEDFPELMVAGEGFSSAAQGLMQDYYDWQSALLLLLPHLSDKTRTRLETWACQHQAQAVYRWHKLYPTVLNRPLLNKALVEAVMRQAHEADGV